MQRLLLRGTAELPNPEVNPKACEKNRGQGDQEKLSGTVQKIIQVMTYLISLAFFAILASLALALWFMLRGGSGGSLQSRRMAKALALRVGVSILLFAGILLAWKFGLIHPTGIAPGA